MTFESPRQRPDPGIDRVVVINDSSVARGGATGLALLSIRLLRARGLSVTLICGDSGEAEEFASLGIEVVALGQSRLLSAGKLAALRAGLHNKAAAEMVAGYLASQDTPGTVYHVHGWAQILSPALFGALRPAAPRVLTHAHDMFLACPNGVYMDFRHQQACTRVPLSWDCLTTHCDKRSYAEKLWRVRRGDLLRKAFDQRMDWGPIALIHPGMVEMLARGQLPTDRLQVVRNPARAWTTTRIPAETNDRFLFVGRLERDKGVDLLAAAARQAGVPVTFVGDGPRRAPLAEAYPEFEFAGWRAKDEIAAFAAQARALVMPSLHPEPFGLVAAEASMSGLPVILSETALMAQDVVPHGLGSTYAPGSTEALAQALRQMAETAPSDLATMSRRAFDRKVPLAQSEEAWISALIEMYGAMLKRTGPAAAPPEPAHVAG